MYPQGEDETEEVLRYRMQAWLIATLCALPPIVASNFLRNIACVDRDAFVVVALNYSSAILMGFSVTLALVATARWTLAYVIPALASMAKANDKVIGWLLWWFCAPSVLEFGYGAIVAAVMPEGMFGPGRDMSGC